MANNKEGLPCSEEGVTREIYFSRLKQMDPVNVWYVTSLCEDIIRYMEGYNLHIWAIGSTVTGVRPKRDYPKPQDIDLLVTHDRMLNGVTFEDNDHYPTKFEKMILEWVKTQSTRFKILELGFLADGGDGDVYVKKLGGAWLVPKVWSSTPINFVVPSENKGGKEALEKIRQGKLVVLHPKT